MYKLRHPCAVHVLSRDTPSQPVVRRRHAFWTEASQIVCRHHSAPSSRKNRSHVHLPFCPTRWSPFSPFSFATVVPSFCPLACTRWSASSSSSISGDVHKRPTAFETKTLNDYNLLFKLFTVPFCYCCSRSTSLDMCRWPFLDLPPPTLIPTTTLSLPSAHVSNTRLTTNKWNEPRNQTTNELRLTLQQRSRDPVPTREIGLWAKPWHRADRTGEARDAEQPGNWYAAPEMSLSHQIVSTWNIVWSKMWRITTNMSIQVWGDANAVWAARV